MEREGLRESKKSNFNKHCNICGDKDFYSQEYYQKHIQSHSEVDFHYICPKCGKSLSPKQTIMRKNGTPLPYIYPHMLHCIGPVNQRISKFKSPLKFCNYCFKLFKTLKCSCRQ